VMTQKSILVVDDSPQNIQAITGLLKAEYKVKAATNASGPWPWRLAPTLPI
jgi:CheY-like chemotaxis protein